MTSKKKVNKKKLIFWYVIALIWIALFALTLKLLIDTDRVNELLTRGDKDNGEVLFDCFLFGAVFWFFINNIFMTVYFEIYTRMQAS